MTKVKGFDNVESVTDGEQQHIYIDGEHIGWLLKKENKNQWKPMYSPKPRHITPLQPTRTKKEAIQALIDRHGE